MAPTPVFVLRTREPLPRGEDLPSWAHWDAKDQLWRCNTGEPYVTRLLSNTETATTTGETLLTDTRESRDQSELTMSQYGETIMTKSIEGTDQTEISVFGSTVKTATREGADQAEIS